MNTGGKKLYDNIYKLDDTKVLIFFDDGHWIWYIFVCKEYKDPEARWLLFYGPNNV